MRISISAPSLTKPTYQTLEEYATKRFKKVDKFLKKKEDYDPEIRLSMTKSGDLFVLNVENSHPSLNARSKDRDMRKVVDIALDQIVRQLKEEKGKTRDNRISRSRVFKKVRSLTGNLFDY